MSLFQQECPGIFLVLSRFLSADNLRVISDDYEAVAGRGGNHEPRVHREEGVSFNPRLARILLIVTREAGLREFPLLRAALYSALHHTTDELMPWVPDELRALVTAIRDPLREDEGASNVRAAITLDAIRHLHMTDYSIAEKETFLEEWKSSPLMAVSSAARDNLRQKLRSALAMQRRRCDLEKSDL